jgi:hypothetical protein
MGEKECYIQTASLLRQTLIININKNDTFKAKCWNYLPFDARRTTLNIKYWNLNRLHNFRLTVTLSIVWSNKQSVPKYNKLIIIIMLFLIW